MLEALEDHVEPWGNDGWSRLERIVAVSP